MSSAVVCDASAMVALLLDGGSDGQWAASVLSGKELLGTSLMLFESSNIFRRHVVAGIVSGDQAAQAHADLSDLAVEQWPYELLAERVWQLRENLSSYDASYVAIAEQTKTPLVTLDKRIIRAPGIRCSVLTP